MKVLNESIDKKGIFIKIFKIETTLGNKIFKIHYECTNGTNKLDALIMNGDGEWKYVFHKYDLGDKFEFTASYVSDITYKEQDAKKGFKLMEELIKKVYL